jgi:hypothetical protein
MGLKFFGSRDSYPTGGPAPVNITVTMPKVPPTPLPLPNPDPSNYEILEHWWSGRHGRQDHYLVVKIRYPDCTNYEGTKILVYRRVYLEELLKQELIDPHFSENPKYISPFARFEPTHRGWEMAIAVCRAMLDVGDKHE